MCSGVSCFSGFLLLSVLGKSKELPLVLGAEGGGCYDGF